MKESSNKNHRYSWSVDPETPPKSDGATSYVNGRYESANAIICNHLKIRLLLLLLPWQVGPKI